VSRHVEWTGRQQYGYATLSFRLPVHSAARPLWAFRCCFVIVLIVYCYVNGGKLIDDDDDDDDIFISSSARQ